MNKQTVRDIDVRGKRVFLRADLNVPLDDGRVTDDARIRASVPTLEHLLAAGAGVAVCSHLGRPKGEPKPELSLAPAAARLGELMGRRVELPVAVKSLVDARSATLAEGAFSVSMRSSIRSRPSSSKPQRVRRATARPAIPRPRASGPTM